MITFVTPKHHWNYFLAIEKDLEKLSRYIEFADANLNTYSIELTHILLSASSEVDVIMKQLCALVDSTKRLGNIDDYKTVIQAGVADLINEEVSIERFGLTFKPWENWSGSNNPNWWRSYNNVKHQRNDHFNQANLQNTINAVGALLVTVIYYYKYAFANEARHDVPIKETTRLLLPESTFLKMKDEYYYDRLIV